MKSGFVYGISLSMILIMPANAERIAHWTFDTDFSDATGRFNGTPKGEARIGQSDDIKRENGAGYLELDGSGDYVTVGFPMPEAGSYSKLAWARFDDDHVGGANIMTAGDAGGGHGLLVWDGTVRVIHGKSGSENRWTDTGEASPANTWTHWAVTYDSSSRSLKIYKNAMLVSEASPAGDVGSHVNPDRIGAYETMSFWKGQIDDVQIWDSVLTQTEIKTHMDN